MLLNARKLWREEDNLELILLAIEDITERKKHEDEMERTRSELKRSNEDLEQFARIAAHDLRNPLNTMVQSAQFLERRNKVLTADPDNRELLD